MGEVVTLYHDPVVVKLVIDGFTFVGVVVVVFCINWRLAAVAVSVFPLHALACACAWSRQQTRKRSIATREHKAAVSSGILDLILGAPAIKAAATQNREALNLKGTRQKAFAANMALGTLFLQQKIVADVVVGIEGSRPRESRLLTLLAHAVYRGVTGDHDASRGLERAKCRSVYSAS